MPPTLIETEKFIIALARNPHRYLRDNWRYFFFRSATGRFLFFCPYFCLFCSSLFILTASVGHSFIQLQEPTDDRHKPGIVAYALMLRRDKSQEGVADRVVTRGVQSLLIIRKANRLRH